MITPQESETELTPEEVDSFWTGKHSQRHWFYDDSIIVYCCILILFGLIFGTVAFIH